MDSLDKLENEKQALQESMKEMPLYLRLKAKKQLETNSSGVKRKKEEKIVVKKGRPKERSSLKPVSIKKQVFEEKKEEWRDPRFSEESGKLDVQKFYDSYGFLKELKKEEVNEISKTLNSKRKLKKMKHEQIRNIKQLRGEYKGDINGFDRLDRMREAKKQIKAENQKNGIRTKFIKKSKLIRSYS